MLSRRLRWETPPNPLAELTAALRGNGARITDLTETNPTRAGLDYPHDEISAAFAAASRRHYAPEPLGLRSAREAIARAYYGGAISPDQIVLTASTSEAYSYLLRLLLDRGDELLTPTPGYPLLDHLAALDSVGLRTFPLELHSRWTIENETLRAGLSPRTRAIALVSPNNPTGTYLTGDEQRSVADVCRESQLALISDEVFADYPLDAPADRAPAAALRHDVLTFSLGGLSKSCGLPHFKLAWIAIGGPSPMRAAVRNALELIADTYLSVSTPVQEALPDLLRIGASLRESILARLRRNLEAARRECDACDALALLPVEGGWSAVLRVPRLDTDEQVALDLLRERGVLVYPGYFFDFPSEGYLVVSLLTAEEEFAAGMRELVSHLSGRLL